MDKNKIKEDLIDKLFAEALEARKKSFSPYSHFKVGAALLCKNGLIIRGCNIENSSYSATNCAERTAIFSAIASGNKEFDAIAIVGGRDDNVEMCYPCGICLQVMAEFCDAQQFVVIVGTGTDKYEAYYLSELLPKAFNL